MNSELVQYHIQLHNLKTKHYTEYNNNNNINTKNQTFGPPNTSRATITGTWIIFKPDTSTKIPCFGIKGTTNMAVNIDLTFIISVYESWYKYALDFKTWIHGGGGSFSGDDKLEDTSQVYKEQTGFTDGGAKDHESFWNEGKPGYRKSAWSWGDADLNQFNNNRKSGWIEEIDIENSKTETQYSEFYQQQGSMAQNQLKDQTCTELRLRCLSYVLIKLESKHQKLRSKLEKYGKMMKKVHQ